MSGSTGVGMSLLQLSCRVQVIEKLIDYRTPAVSELTKKHNGGIQGRLIQRPESITPHAVRFSAIDGLGIRPEPNSDNYEK